MQNPTEHRNKTLLTCNPSLSTGYLSLLLLIKSSVLLSDVMQVQTQHQFPQQMQMWGVSVSRSPELVCSSSELHPLRSDWHWCSHYCRSVDEYGCDQLWKKRARLSCAPMMLCKFSGGTILFQVLFSVPHKKQKHLPDENTQLKQIKHTGIYLMWCFVSWGPFQVVVEKDSEKEKEETATVSLFVTEELKKGEEKKTW